MLWIFDSPARPIRSYLGTGRSYMFYFYFLSCTVPSLHSKSIQAQQEVPEVAAIEFRRERFDRRLEDRYSSGEGVCMQSQNTLNIIGYSLLNLLDSSAEYLRSHVRSNRSTYLFLHAGCASTFRRNQKNQRMSDPRPTKSCHQSFDSRSIGRTFIWRGRIL